MGALGAGSGDILQRYVVSVDADTDDLKHGLRDAGSESNRAFESMQKDVTITETRMQSLARTMRTVVIPAMVAGGAALTAMKIAAVSSDRSLRILRNSLIDIDQPGQNSARTIANLADKLSHFTTTSEGKVMRLAAVGATLGRLTGRDLEQATAAAIGLAARFGHLGVSSEEAMRMIARAANGDTTSLRKLGIQLDDSMSGQEKYNALLQIGARGLKVAGEEAKTTEGQLRRLSNASKQLFAAGGRLLGLGEKGGGVLEIVIDGIEVATTKVDAFRDTLVGLRDDALALVGIDPANLFSFGSIKIEMEGLIDRGAVKIAGFMVGLEAQAIHLGETIEAKLVGAAEAFRDSMIGVGSDIKAWITDQADTIRRRFFGLPDPLPEVPMQVHHLRPDFMGRNDPREVLPTTREGAIEWMRQLTKEKRDVEVGEIPSPTTPAEKLKADRDVEVAEIVSPTLSADTLRAMHADMVAKYRFEILKAAEDPPLFDPAGRFLDIISDKKPEPGYYDPFNLPLEVLPGSSDVLDQEWERVRRDSNGLNPGQANAGGVGPGVFSAAANVAMLAIATPLGESLKEFIDGYTQREKDRQSLLTRMRLENERSKSTTDTDALATFIDSLFGVASSRGVGLGDVAAKGQTAAIATAIGSLTIAGGVARTDTDKQQASPEEQLKQMKDVTKHVLNIFRLLNRPTSSRPVLR